VAADIRAVAAVGWDRAVRGLEATELQRVTQQCHTLPVRVEEHGRKASLSMIATE
jgi:hypothetical protein